jgi:acyl carrier protein
MSAAATPLMDQIYAVIREVLEEAVDLDEDTALWSVGVDSIGIVHVVAICEGKFGIDLDPEDLTLSALQTPGHIARLLQEKYAVPSLA